MPSEERAGQSPVFNIPSLGDPSQCTRSSTVQTPVAQNDVALAVLGALLCDGRRLPKSAIEIASNPLASLSLSLSFPFSSSTNRASLVASVHSLYLSSVPVYPADVSHSFISPWTGLRSRGRNQPSTPTKTSAPNPDPTLQYQELHNAALHPRSRGFPHSQRPRCLPVTL